MNTYKITELMGDGIATELSKSVHTVVSALPVKLEMEQIDLTLPAREKDAKGCYDRALESMIKTAASMKYPTATKKESPNKVLRERCHFSVIHRPCVSIPGVPTNFKKPIDIDIVRVATGGTYDDAGRRIGLHSAVSVRVIEKLPCKQAALFAYQLAGKRGRTVISSSKYTIQQATDGLFEDAVDEVAKQYPFIKHERVLFDALLAKLTMQPESVQVVVCPNEYGDFLSDCAAGLIGSLGLADSASYSYKEDGSVHMAMFDPAGGTAPDIAGKDIANPTAALFALCTMLIFLGEVETGQKLKAAILKCLESGKRTRDLGGSLGTEAFTAAVAETFARV
ncbi:MAG TPA: isocitrate/isopropylmalate family dehydrogenase [Planctomycetota bacterium]|nr:isocitrate/isopropylmalate family dehydrogenase [Planctomycetota bacterium]